MECLKIPSLIWDAMRRHARRSSPLEACGLLAGKADQVEIRIGVRNADQSPVSYHMEPREQWRAFQRMEKDGLDLQAIYHSHPKGPDRPSATDISEAMYPVVQIIWYRLESQWRARGFWIEKDLVSEVTLDII